jgi:hypothetical protein
MSVNARRETRIGNTGCFTSPSLYFRAPLLRPRSAPHVEDDELPFHFPPVCFEVSDSGDDIRISHRFGGINILVDRQDPAVTGIPLVQLPEIAGVPCDKGSAIASCLLQDGLIILTRKPGVPHRAHIPPLRPEHRHQNPGGAVLVKQ